MFNKNFYPTPKKLVQTLLDLGQGRVGRMILEPSAGKGDIIEYLKEKDRNVKVDAIELNEDLHNLLVGKGEAVVWDDFLTFQTHREYSAIVMNPPFDNGDKHLLKAIDLAEKQVGLSCSIYAIVNAETLRNPFSNARKELMVLLEKYQAKVEFITDAFMDAERKTGVEVALIYLQIAPRKYAKEIYENLLKRASRRSATQSTELVELTAEHFLKVNLEQIQRYIMEYDTAVLLIKESYVATNRREEFIDYLSTLNEDIRFFELNSNYTVDKLQNELDYLRQKYWRLILNTKAFKEVLTNDAGNLLEKKLAEAMNMEINMINVEILLRALVANHESFLLESCVRLFEKLTQYHMNEYSKNVHYYNGWKTNDAFKINNKVIMPTYSCSIDLKYNNFYKDDYKKLNVGAIIQDIVKMMRLFNPAVNDDFQNNGQNDFENDYLRFKVFKKGTLHIWFKDQLLLNQFNFVCGQHYNWLPTEEEMRTAEAKSFVYDLFGQMDTNIQLLA